MPTDEAIKGDNLRHYSRLSAKRCNAPEVNNKSYDRSNSDRLVLRKDLLEQAEEIHIWKKKFEVFLRQLVFETDESARTSKLNPVYQIRHNKQDENVTYKAHPFHK
ncbi:hypothetical protein P5673_002037 [Acropora cervicornis]|uniref:Uncharacterized protein n=1 Tax=Acropora cervicornis TaxID=6130 RepID=A0AAD9R4K5_ACRCE|nr:hypothetical protein P5673_002037 [Acropora cervicornis]